MIKTHACYTAACDVCGNDYDDGEGIRVFDTADDAIAFIRDSCEGYWWVAKAPGTTVLCDSESDEHLAKARELAAAMEDPDERETLLSLYREIDSSQFERMFSDATPGQSETPAVAK